MRGRIARGLSLLGAAVSIHRLTFASLPVRLPWEDGLICGYSTARGQQPVTARAAHGRVSLHAVIDRQQALQTLGLDVHTTPDIGAVRRAFRRAVREHHPDRPTGDAVQFHAAKQAYDLLAGRNTGTTPSKARWSNHARDVRDSRFDFSGGNAGVWRYKKKASDPRWVPHTDPVPADFDEGWDAAGYNPYTGQYHGPADTPEAAYWNTYVENEAKQRPRPKAAQPRPKAAQPRPGSHASTEAPHWLLPGFISLMVFAASPSYYRGPASADIEQLAAAADPPSSIRFPQRPGIEYAWAAVAAKGQQAPLVFLDMEATGPLGLSLKGDDAHTFADTVFAALNARHEGTDRNQHRFQRIVAVVREERLQQLTGIVRDRSAGAHASGGPAVEAFSDPEYFEQSGRPMAAIHHHITGQEVTFVGASTHDRLGDGLPDLARAMKSGDFDAVVMDITKQVWEDRREEFAVWTGTELKQGMDVVKPSDLSPPVRVRGMRGPQLV